MPGHTLDDAEHHERFEQDDGSRWMRRFKLRLIGPFVPEKDLRAERMFEELGYRAPAARPRGAGMGAAIARFLSAMPGRFAADAVSPH
ncbi:MAG: hypothetical protein JSR59_00760 [Proteobacteria bacterium]|nr:hypothetical protein [Pseudomonadota bacterium]